MQLKPYGHLFIFLCAKVFGTLYLYPARWITLIMTEAEIRVKTVIDWLGNFFCCKSLGRPSDKGDNSH